MISRKLKSHFHVNKNFDPLHKQYKHFAFRPKFIREKLSQWITTCLVWLTNCQDQGNPTAMIFCYSCQAFQTLIQIQFYLQQFELKTLSHFMISGKTFKEKAASYLDSNPTINVPILKTVSVFFILYSPSSFIKQSEIFQQWK